MRRTDKQTMPWQLAFLCGQLTVFAAVVVTFPEVLPPISDLWEDENRQILEQVPQLKPSAGLMLLLQQLQIWGILTGVGLTLCRTPGAFRYWVTYFLLLISLSSAGLFVFDTVRLELIFSHQATLTADVIHWIGELLRTCAVAAFSLAFLFLPPCRGAFPAAADGHSVRWDRVVFLLSLPLLANAAIYWLQQRDHHTAFDRAQIDKACDSKGASYFCWRGEKHGRFGRIHFTPKDGIFLEAVSTTEPSTGRDAVLFRFQGQKKSDPARTFSALFVSADDTPLDRGLYERPLPVGPLGLFRGQGPWPTFRLWWADEEDYCVNSRGSFEILELQRSGKKIDKALIRFHLQCTGRESSRLIGKLCLNCQDAGALAGPRFPMPLPPREDSPGPFPLAGGLSEMSLGGGERLDSLCAEPTESYLCAYKGKSPTEAEGALHDLSAERLSIDRDRGWKLRAHRLQVEIEPPRGTFLAPGVYFNPSPHRRGTGPNFRVSRYHPSCEAETQKELFVVEQLEQAPSGEVLRLAVSFELRCENQAGKSVWGRLCYRCDKGIFQRRVPRTSVAGLSLSEDSKLEPKSASRRLAHSDLNKVCPTGSSSYYCGFRPVGCDRNRPVFSRLGSYSLELGENQELRIIEAGQSWQTPSFVLRPPFGETLQQGLYRMPKYEHFLRPGLRFRYEHQSQAELEIRKLQFDTEGRPVMLEADIRHTCDAAEAWSRICVGCEPRS